MGYWPKYVSVAKRREQAAKEVKSAKKSGYRLNPVVVEGRTIAHTFWGKAWCDFLENYSDYDNRLPRGRTYARNGSIIDLQISKGVVKAQVVGSSLYKITIEIEPMDSRKWKSLVATCSGKIDSMIELLQGKFSKSVMSTIIDQGSGFFPEPSEISMRCTCPDHASLCKHIAAVFYGIGACLDHKPEWLFTLRHVDHLELITTAATGNISGSGADVLEEESLSALFGIEIAESLLHSTPLPAKKEPLPEVKKAVEKSPPLEPFYLTLAQVADLLETSRPKLSKLLAENLIPFQRVGRQKLITLEEAIKYREKAGLAPQEGKYL